MKWLSRVGAAALLVILLAACGGTGSPSGGSTPPPAAAQASASASESSDTAAWEAQLKADDKAAQQRVGGIETRVKAEPSPEKKLSILVTEYCKALGGYTGVDEDVSRMLEQTYAKYWVAGTKWNTPLSSAAVQQGGCPDVVKSASRG